MAATGLRVSLLLFVFCMAPFAHSQSDAEKLLDSKCSACHTRDGDGLDRIKDSRRTPEGWDMTLVRMMLVHGVPMTGAERATLAKYLADNYGLAPSETANHRYILERQPNMVEAQPDDTLSQMCARCHSYARFSVQRRTEDDWRKLVHFHLGQWPTSEYQAMGRDRNWWEIARDEVPPLLAQSFPLESSTWDEWSAKPHPAITGRWRVTGSQAGKGPYEGSMTFTATGEDQYSVDTVLNFANGETLTGTSSAVVYTGYEIRARGTLGSDTVLTVSAMAENGATIAGRWFLEDNDAIGSNFGAARDDGMSRVLAVSGSSIKVGSTAEIAIHGTNLSGNVNLGDGIAIDEIVESSANSIIVKATAAEDADPGLRNVTVGGATLADQFAVYQNIDAVRVEPEIAISRVGDDGPLAPVPAQFDAIAYAKGADGEVGTDDDIRLGVVPATWSIENFSEAATAMEDTNFAGRIDEATGLFHPAAPGPNPARPFGTNNVGDIAVNATVTDGDAEHIGTAHLIVTVQRWNDPPIR